ncbi:SH3 domain-containing protein [Colletotrichum truncatum]|uniref:SH3 domain-containing protein n=1 Tax=Colletotrichum truncatum TaxID=5467 RepID=A0ACC3Z0D3_COLTU|nr:SH3 domain-containing protein [Colletotrichum truncatum]KAF6800674.1 SH3 domain-containing protein [Colletotrichum truncatum]
MGSSSFIPAPVVHLSAKMDRQTIIETNRSLRNIKNELENLLEKGVITEDAYDNIHATLPAETPLHGAANRAAPQASTPVQHSNPTSPPTADLAALNIQPNPSPAPPSYAQTGPPSLPSRQPEKPILAHARALYRYAGADARDVSFERDDRIAIHEYMNADWWMGRNLRTGQEGIFPKTYVLVEQDSAKGAFAPQPQYAPQQAQWAPQQQQYAPQQPVYGQPPQGPPPQQNPYNADAPPQAVADQNTNAEGSGGGKAGEMGKKFGKKLGNAAIFGAGATIGSNIVNSIF